ncbi:hypothetical protein [Halanaerobacter jeridensis]|uniref:Uncharacterized protein n=1 Tax=Halanaerobacter jeridensis TaxID=706427 RepID=A0A938XUV8_9FIRM|nr:hypothetical protein [Halanaerobacter jeridensis]MBM7557950.1 hypothetical protein [Halanaerobacter jeridensis]
MKDQEGAVFMIGLMIIIVLVPIGIVVSNNVITGIKATNQVEEQTKALSVSESGFEIVMYDLMDKLSTVNTVSGAIHSIPDITSLPAVGNGTWSSYHENLGFKNGKYKYKLEQYQTGPNNGLVKLSIQGKYKDVTQKIAASVYPGGSITDIIDRYKLHLVADDIEYPWVKEFTECNSWNFNKNNLIKMRNMINLFDFEAFKTAAKNSSRQRYFENLTGQLSGNAGGENIFQRVYSKKGAGSEWEPEDRDRILGEYRSSGWWGGYYDGDYWENVFGKEPPLPPAVEDLPEGAPKANLPGGIFYLDPEDQGFQLELGEYNLVGPQDDPTVIVLEGDMSISDFERNSIKKLSNIYFVVKGQVEFTGRHRNEFKDLQTENSFIYSAKNFKWNVVDEDTGEREKAIDYGDGRPGVGSIHDKRPAISGSITNNYFHGPILTSGAVDVGGMKEEPEKNPKYDPDFSQAREDVDKTRLAMVWEALEAGLNDQAGTIYPRVINWTEK